MASTEGAEALRLPDRGAAAAKACGRPFRVFGAEKEKMPRSPSPVPVFDHSAEPSVGRMPRWIRASLAADPRYGETARRLQTGTLHTVCEEARCPNRGECWSRGTATFLLLGDTCTRACGFCAVRTGRPAPENPGEALEVADAVESLGLRYVVLTSVNRDDLPDGGAAQFGRVISELRRRSPGVGIELLTPDFRRAQGLAVETIMAALEGKGEARKTELVWGHNVETVPRLYRRVRKGSDYSRSLALLERVAALPRVEAKSSLMLGLGEKPEEVTEVMRDLRSAGVSRLALGQYLRPSRFHLPVREYLSPERFSRYEREARALGFRWIKAGPLVRSSYHAETEQES